MAKKRIAIYPGTFDPITYGHMDILIRATHLFDEVILAVVENPSKSTLFPFAERINLLKQSVKGIKYKCPVRIESFSGLMVKFAKSRKAFTVVRGLRAVSDFEYEFQMALMNRHLAREVETVFLMPDEKFVYLSSSMVKVIARHKGNLSDFLSGPVRKALEKKFK